MWVLSRAPSLYSNQRLVDAALRRALEVHVVNPAVLVAGVGLHGAPALWTAGGAELTPLPHVVVPRVPARGGTRTRAVVAVLEAAGVDVLNPCAALDLASDKLATAMRLAQCGVDTPAAVALTPGVAPQRLLPLVGGLPVVLKLTRGSHGVGVMLCRTRAELNAHAAALWQAGAHVMMQRFVRESVGRDIRVVVVGGHAVAAMERRAPRGEFRSNLHQGGRAMPVPLGADLRRVAQAAAAALGLGVAGVDILRGAQGPCVVEVNGSPGLKGIERVSGVDVAGAIVDLAAARAGASTPARASATARPN